MASPSVLVVLPPGRGGWLPAPALTLYDDPALPYDSPIVYSDEQANPYPTAAVLGEPRTEVEL